MYFIIKNEKKTKKMKKKFWGVGAGLKTKMAKIGPKNCKKFDVSYVILSHLRFKDFKRMKMSR